MTETPNETPAIVPVILSGGSGSRLWPLSRSAFPKQFLSLAGMHTMIQETALRVDVPGYGAPLLVSNREHRFLLAEQMREIGVAPRAILLEPVARNTAAAVAAAAAVVAEADPAAPLLVLPSDHVIDDVPAFHAAVARALPLARAGALVLFGITPDYPATGYGYIRAGAPAGAGFAVARFVEKPDAATAAAYLAEGGYSWNSGMFLFRADAILAALAEHAPEVAQAAAAAAAARRADLDFEVLDADAFSAAPSVSIDVAVMEKTDRAVVVPAALGWNDIGAFPALWERADKDCKGNALLGDVAALDTEGCYIRAGERLVAVVGVKDLVIAETGDAVLVAAKDRAQEVGDLFKRLADADRIEAEQPLLVHRPWGTFKSVDAGDRFHVKEIAVSPGRRLSVQRHHHRAEHWVVVEGTARVLRGEEWMMVYENQSVFIPIGMVHCLENPGKIPLRLIEVQSGAYLGEDDIERLDDVYGRAVPEPT
ncbi:mannose-1-phosphate guanylyltransferase/mannose-6-phosphate isomerase [Oleispirillum naphthae]|uniref:mannose-1-phosphate guanylyltransferase/mannose-6-phosphate isomerase n=1 Tax=Oleispirillum naphthae TaxID=2838853 RepID=UPI0030823F90